MLEWAVPCLDTGARYSLRAQRQIPRSKRLLHPTFWTHGAGDLNLPPWAIPTPLTGSVTDSIIHRGDDAQEEAVGKGVRPEGLLLDFLYPPKTQAYMRRVHRWERRQAAVNARKTGMRGFSSLKTMPRDDAHINEQGASGLSGRHATAVRQYSEATFHPFADARTAPNGPVAEKQARPPSEVLDRILLQETGQNACSRAWAVYFALDKSLRDNVSLKRRLIAWFSRQDCDIGADYALRLLDRLDPSDRNASTYYASISACLQQDDIAKALQIHNEGLQVVETSSIGSNLLMQKCLTEGNWTLAVQLFQDSKEKRQRLSPRQQDIALFQDVGKTFGTGARLHKSSRMISNLLDNIDRRSGEDPFRKSLLQMLEPLWDAYVYGIRLLLGHRDHPQLAGIFRKNFTRAHGMGIASPRLFEASLTQLITTDNHGKQHGLYAIVSWLYLLYRQMNGSKPSVPLLHRLVLFWKLENQVDRARSTIRITGTNHLSATKHLGGAKHLNIEPYVGTKHISIELLVADWRRHHSALDDGVLFALMETFAHLGDVSAVQLYANEYASLHAVDGVQSSRLWPLVHVHAVRNDAVGASDQLLSLESEYHVKPDLRCWNALLYACQRIDDLPRALAAFKKITASGIKPDQFTFGPLLTMYGKQGDVEGAREILKMAERHLVRPSTLMLNGLIVACVNADDIEGADDALESAMEAVKAGRVDGSMSPCLNTMMTAYTLRRDSQMTMQIYRYMKDEDIAMDRNTYASLLQSLCFYRQTDVAEKILRKIMPAKGVKAAAIHYAIVMAGYVNQNKYLQALRIHRNMVRMDVRPTLSTRIVYLKAKALLEHANTGAVGHDSPDPVPLQDTLHELLKVLDMVNPVTHGKMPEPGARHLPKESATAAYFSFLIYIHGERQCFQAVKQLFRLYDSKMDEQGLGEDAPPIRLLTALMSVHLRAHEYSAVEHYWHLAKEQADRLREIPTPPRASDGTEPNMVTSDSAPTVQTRPSQAQRYTLSRPLRFHLAALFASNPPKLQEMTTTVASLLKAGYSLDNRTWNAYIRFLCRASPPRALLAFTLVERFMIPNWPGWVQTSHVLTNATARPGAADRAEGMEYIRARYLPPGKLVPQYRTMVHLAAALVELQKREVTGGSRPRGVRDKAQREAEAQVGSVQGIRERAPRTYQAVQTMPTVFDRLQKTLLRPDIEGD